MYGIVHGYKANCSICRLYQSHVNLSSDSHRQVRRVMLAASEDPAKKYVDESLHYHQVAERLQGRLAAADSIIADLRKRIPQHAVEPPRKKKSILSATDRLERRAVSKSGLSFNAAKATVWNLDSDSDDDLMPSLTPAKHASSSKQSAHVPSPSSSSPTSASVWPATVDEFIAYLQYPSQRPFVGPAHTASIPPRDPGIPHLDDAVRHFATLAHTIPTSDDLKLNPSLTMRINDARRTVKQWLGELESVPSGAITPREQWFRKFWISPASLKKRVASLD